MDWLADFVATVSAEDQQLGDWLQQALAAFMAGETVPRFKRSWTSVPGNAARQSAGNDGSNDGPIPTLTKKLGRPRFPKPWITHKIGAREAL